ncbi:MAG: hypothetical protein NTY19_09165 [Planctomycetota bacterium]|nr:hypothetical protein [Planctomycetota bacterium]
MEQILRYRHRFTSVVILTKNPSHAAKPDYLELLQKLNELPAGHASHDAFTEVLKDRQQRQPSRAAHETITLQKLIGGAYGIPVQAA